MKPTHVITLLATMALPHFAFAKEEDEKPVKFEDLPAAAAKAIKDAAGDSALKSIVAGKEDGIMAYEAVWEAKGHQHEIAVDKEGAVLCLEEILKLEEAPEVIRAAITKEAGANKVLEVEKVLEKGVTSFEAEIQEGKTKVTVSFDEKGKVLEREKDEEKAEGGKKSEKDEDGEEEDDDKDEKK